MLDPDSAEFAAAHNLWTKGKGHLFGVLALEQASRTYAELLTKTAYILHGGDPEVVRKPGIGHDLIALLDAAEEQGFSAPDRHTRAIFEYLREPHRNHQFRYGEMDNVPMPDLVHTIPALQVMSNELQDILEATG